jgi:hypothetical protein
VVFCRAVKAEIPIAKNEIPNSNKRQNNKTNRSVIAGEAKQTLMKFLSLDGRG